MPCFSDQPSKADEYCDVLTRLACDRCKDIIARGKKIPKWAQDWWEYHQEEDKQHKQMDKEEREEEKLRKQALAKLTKEERAVLRNF